MVSYLFQELFFYKDYRNLSPQGNLTVVTYLHVTSDGGEESIATGSISRPGRTTLKFPVTEDQPVGAIEVTAISQEEGFISYFFNARVNASGEPPT